MADIKDIVNDDPEELSEDDLMHFLQQPQEMEAAFSKDAQEGLGAFQSNDKLQQYAAQLNQHLQQQLHTRKKHKENRKISHLSWPLLALIIILALCILGYAMIRLYHAR